jgi:tetratricopeptide (TPR) repeat protein
MKQTFITSVFVVGLSLGFVASAQKPCQSTPESLELAKTYYQLGNQTFDRGNYPEAIRNFQEALGLSCFKILLYNIAQSYRTMAEGQTAAEQRSEREENYRQALSYYQQFLKESPADDYPDKRQDAEQHLAEINRLLTPTPPATKPGAPKQPEPDLPSDTSKKFKLALVGTSVGVVCWSVATIIKIENTLTPDLTIAEKRIGQITSVAGDVLAIGAGTASTLLFLKMRKEQSLTPALSITPSSVSARWSF